MKRYELTKENFTNFKNENLKLKWKLSEIINMGLLTDKELEAYQKFFKYADNLEKRLFYV